jgi:hypothetical protein
LLRIAAKLDEYFKISKYCGIKVNSFIEALLVGGLFHPCFVSRFLPFPLKSPFRTFNILQSGWLSPESAKAFLLYIRAIVEVELFFIASQKKN